ncbi:MAG: hypothetical protein QW111_07060 [Ignisphaera sp.]
MASQKFLEEASKHVEPIYAQGFFYVSLGCISYYLVFDYNDPYEYYGTIVKDEKAFNDEVTKLWMNMQKFLDGEIVVINGTRVSPRVVMIDIGFRGSRRRPYIVFGIRFRAPIRIGLNIYENRYSPEVVEYDYVAYWIFPPSSKIIKVDMGQGNEEWDIVGKNILAIYGFRGKKSGGYEYIEFEIRDYVKTDAGETN